MRHMSQEWEQHQGYTKLDSGKTRKPFIWAANIIQVLLTYTIELWEERNQDVHGRTTTEQKQKLIDKHKITMQNLEKTDTSMKSKPLT